MKKIFFIFCAINLLYSKMSYAQSAEAQQLILNVEKLAQLKKILNNMYQGYQVVNKGYSTIKDISKGNFNLHDAFLKSLLDISPSIRRYKRVRDVLGCQASIVKEYRSAFTRFKRSNLFNDGEIRYMANVYDNLFRKSLQNLDELTMIITSGKLRMSDDERINAIDRIFTDMQDKLTFLRVFNRENTVLVVQRGRELVDTKISKKLSGL